MMSIEQRRGSRAPAAALVGGVGTVLILLGYQALPQMLADPSLEIRQPQGALFLAWTFTVGAVGGAAGHNLFLSRSAAMLSRAGGVRRAVMVGGTVGLAVALVGWSAVFVLRRYLFPFQPFHGMEQMMFTWLRNALLAGPLAGVAVSVIVAKVIDLEPQGRDETRMSR